MLQRTLSGFPDLQDISYLTKIENYIQRLMLNMEDIAIYAATLSTILLIIKIYEMWKERFRLEAWLTIDGPDHDKEIKIVNLSKTPTLPQASRL